MFNRRLVRTSGKILSSDVIREIEGGVVFTVKIVPGSSRTGVSGLFDGMVKIKVSAPPEKGKANRCLVEFLAKQVGIKKNAVSIISGETNPVKDVRLLGVSAKEIGERLGLAGHV
jgi:uncharacterized protein (TIGR00251 family)